MFISIARSRQQANEVSYIFPLFGTSDPYCPTMTSTDTPHSHNASQDLNANIVSTLDNGKAMERAINTEATWLFNGNIEVVTADQMLKQHFSKSELLAEADKQPILETLVRYLGEVDLSTIEDERHMYQPLVSLACLKTYW